MKHRATWLAGALAVLTVTGCGGTDRASLATQTVRTYWSDIDHGKLSNAYRLLTPGVRAQRPRNEYTQDMFQFLERMGGIRAKTGKPRLDGDQASVPVTLSSPRTTETVSAYQHLFWQSDHWQISDPNGGLSPVK